MEPPPTATVLEYLELTFPATSEGLLDVVSALVPEAVVVVVVVVEELAFPEMLVFVVSFRIVLRL